MVQNWWNAGWLLPQIVPKIICNVYIYTQDEPTKPVWKISGQLVQTLHTNPSNTAVSAPHTLQCVNVIAKLRMLTYSNGVRPVFGNFFGVQVHGLVLFCSCNQMLVLFVHTIHTILDSPPFRCGQHGHFAQVYWWIWFMVHLCWVNCWRIRCSSRCKLQRGLWTSDSNNCRDFYTFKKNSKDQRLGALNGNFSKTSEGHANIFSPVVLEHTQITLLNTPMAGHTILTLFYTVYGRSHCMVFCKQKTFSI